MTIGQAFLEALESLSGNKLRSGLTVLGIVIGVAAVIAMLAVGKGAQESITSSINSIGTNLLVVFPGGKGQDRFRPLTMRDADALGDQLAAPSIEAVAPTLEIGGEVTFGGQQTSSPLIGVTPAYFQVRNVNLAEGEFITEEHLLGRASVVLLGPEVAETLFGHTDGITGETVRIDGQPFRVIGVLESKGGGEFGSEDNQMIVPLTTAKARLFGPKSGQSGDRVDAIYVQAAGADLVSQAIEEIAQILRTRHRITDETDDFTIFTQQDLLTEAETITNVLTIFLGGIAGISLLVGGIGIMNIMLVSVTERTHEIGLRKAIGARKRDILTQFLTESSLLSLIGGMIGILFGWLISLIVGQIAAANNAPFTPVVGLDAIMLATIFSAAIGLFFGIYPANRAASLEPVEALRYE
ncbi:MAG TPA: ABC transporter permease [Anaerolineales bacterium]|nr:ABC transporter permease [Anaerolineales bacterium]